MTTFTSGQFNYLITGDNTCTLGKDPQLDANAPILGLEFEGVADIPKYVTYQGVNYTVNIIGRYAFRNCHKMTGLIIPSTIIQLSYDMIYETKVKNILIPSSVQTIQNSAFSHTNSLEKIQFEAGSQIKKLEYNSLASATALKYIIIPPSVEIIENRTFYNDPNLRFIIYYGTNDLSTLTPEVFGNIFHPVTVYVTKDYPSDKFAQQKVTVLNSQCIFSINFSLYSNCIKIRSPHTSLLFVTIFLHF